MIIEMNNNDKFDIDLSQLNSSINDRNLFHKSEEVTIRNINNFISTTHEFKNQPSALNTGNLFFEYKMLVNNKEHYSGIHTSQAKLQTNSIGEITISFPTEFIHWCYVNRKKLELDDKDKNDTNYIATGFLLPFARITDLYNQFHNEKRLRELYKNKNI